MKKVALFIGIALVLTLGTFGCSDNFRTKHWGGTMTIDVPKDEKVTVVTWKGEELWYLTRPMREGETAETLTLREKSSYGVVEGTVVLKESK